MEQLFTQASLVDWLASQEAQLREEVERLNRDEILAVSEEDLVAHLVSRYLVESIELSLDEMYVEQEEAQIDVSFDPWRDVRAGGRYTVPGTKVTVGVPYSGDSVLWKLRTNQWSSSIPSADIGNEEIRITYLERSIDGVSLRSRIDGDVAKIQQWLQYQVGPIAQFNDQLAHSARRLITERRDRLLQAEGAVQALGLPVRRRGDAPRSYPVPGVRRKPHKVTPKPSPTERFAAEFAITDEQYGEILGVIAQMTEVFERSPHAFASLGEEDLRWQLLVPLNGLFEGGASGETFNYEGKTDVLIKHEGRVAFVAECKLWAGPRR
jgi:hypothetical protein